MTELMWVRSHVERLLQEEWDQCRVIVDDDGDYPFRRGTAACWVSVLDHDPIMVRVWAHAAINVKPSARLLRELNAIQGRTLSASVELCGSPVTVKQTINPIGLTQPVLAQALLAVGRVAEDVGILVAAMFDGATPFDAEICENEEAS